MLFIVHFVYHLCDCHWLINGSLTWIAHLYCLDM